MNCEPSYYRASLCIHSKVVSAKNITEILGTSPTNYYEKGTAISTRNSNSIIRKESTWILDSKVLEEEALHLHIEQLVCFIEDHSKEFNTLVDTCNMEILCGFFLMATTNQFI